MRLLLDLLLDSQALIVQMLPDRLVHLPSQLGMFFIVIIIILLHSLVSCFARTVLAIRISGVVKLVRVILLTKEGMILLSLLGTLLERVMLLFHIMYPLPIRLKKIISLLHEDAEMQLFIQFIIIMSQAKFEKVLKKYKQKYEMKKPEFVRFLKEKVDLSNEQIDQFVKVSESRGILKQKFNHEELQNVMHFVAAFQANQNIYTLGDATKFVKMRFKMGKEEKQKKYQSQIGFQDNIKEKETMKVEIKIKQVNNGQLALNESQSKDKSLKEEAKQQAITINVDDINNDEELQVSYDHERLREEIEWEEERLKKEKQEQVRMKYLKEFQKKEQERKKRNFIEDEVFKQKDNGKQQERRRQDEESRQRLKQREMQKERQRFKQKDRQKQILEARQLYKQKEKELDKQRERQLQQEKGKIKESDQKNRTTAKQKQNQMKRVYYEREEKRETERDREIEFKRQKTTEKNRQAINNIKQEYFLANQNERAQQKLLITQKDSKELINILKFEKTGQQYMNPVIKYQIKYKEKYITWRRYSQVEKLLQYLRCKYEGVVFPELPPKQGIQRSFNFFLQSKINEQFLDERRQKLKQFLNRLLSSSTIREDEILQKFLTDQYFELPNLSESSVSYIQSIYQWKDFVFNYNELKDYGLAYYKYLSDYRKKDLKTSCALQYEKLLVSIEQITTVNEYKTILTENFSKRRELLFKYKVKIREPEKTDLDVELEEMQLKYKELHSEYQNYLYLKSREGWEIELLKQKESNGGETMKKIMEEHKTTTERVWKIENNLEKQIKQISKKNQKLLEKLQRLIIEWRTKIHP